jgi:hypothetical protein
MKILLLVAAAVGLGAIMAGNVVPDVTQVPADQKDVGDADRRVGVVLPHRRMTLIPAATAAGPSNPAAATSWSASTCQLGEQASTKLVFGPAPKMAQP